METLKDVEAMNEFDLHLPNEALPVVISQNKAVVGKISLSNFPTGNRNDYGGGGTQNTELEITVSNSQQLLLVNSCICCDVKLTGQAAGNVKFRGGQTIFKSLSVSLNNKKLVDLQNHADVVGDFHVNSVSTNDELQQLESITGYKKTIANGSVTSLRIPLKWFGLEIGNLIPTGTIGATLRINANINTSPLSQLSAGTQPVDVNALLTYNNFRLESEFVELQPMLLSKRIEKIKSSTGLTIPFHCYTVDSRIIPNITTMSERIALSYNNVVALYQLPFKKLKNVPNYYGNVKWDASMELVKDYLVNFDGGQYYNYNSNGGQSGLASHAQALMDATRCEFCVAGAGAAIINGINDYQALAVNFVRSNNVLSPAITDSGVNARLQSGMINTQCSFGAPLVDIQLITIVKFTRRLIMKNSSMDVFS
jgi:hypothetical protein